MDPGIFADANSTTFALLILVRHNWSFVVLQGIYILSLSTV